MTSNSDKPKPIPEKNEKGQYIMTEQYCSELCEYNGHYYQPTLNGNLYLHYKGFKKIENLDAFINVKVLYLENNCLKTIENLSHMKQLSCL
jgi:dynein assembly factor 1, axonemal